MSKMAFAVKHIEKPTPVRTVTVVDVPAEVKTAMDAEWEFAQKNPGYVTVISGASESEAKQNLILAKAWGMQRKDGQKVTVTKNPGKPGKDNPLEMRVTLTKYDPDATKRGRPAQNGNSAK
jgi:hypothetical protein